MTQTTSAAWEIARHHRSNSACFIVHFFSGSYDLYLSTRPLNLPGTALPTIEEGVKSFSPISHGVDIRTFGYRQNSIRITLSSGWTRRTVDGEQYNYADTLGYIVGAQTNVYFYPGSAVQALGDCLRVFMGSVTRVYVSTDGIEVECDATGLIRHRDLPQTIATRADYPNIPPEHDGVVIGMWYGSPYETNPVGNASITQRSGAVIPLLVSRGATDRSTGGAILKYKVDSARFPGLGVANFYIFISCLNAWSWCYNENTCVDETDIETDGTFTLNTDTSRWKAFLYPTHALPSSSATENALQACDRIEDSVCNVVASTSSYADVVFEWTNQGVTENSSIYNSLADMVSVLDSLGNTGMAHLSTIRTRVSGAITAAYIDVWDGSSWINFTSDLTWTNSNRRDYTVDVAGSFYWNGVGVGGTGVFWHLGNGPSNGDGLPLAIRFRFVNSGASWTPDVTEVATIEEVLIKIHHKWPRNFQPERASRKASRRGYLAPSNSRPSAGRPHYKEISLPSEGQVVATGADDNVDRLLCESTGRSYGSWIESRFPGYTDTQIYEPVFVLESILRDELAVSAGNIDTDSIDAFMTIYYGAPDSLTWGPMAIIGLPPNSRIFSANLIERFCWEWGMFMFQSRNALVKVFDYEIGLDDLGTIFPSDLVNGLPILETLPVSDIVNKIVIRHTKTEWDDAFAFTETATDATSITKWGTIPDNVDCAYLRIVSGGDSDSNNLFLDGRRSVDRLIDRLIGGAPQAPSSTPQRILSRPHAYVTLQTIGHKYAHAEPGDWIALDAASFDPVFKFFGQTWDGIALMVVETEVTETMTILKTFNWQPLPLT